MSCEDLLFIPEDELDGLQDLSGSEIGGGEALVQPLSLSQTNYEGIYLKRHELVDPAYPLHDIRKKNSKDMIKSVLVQSIIMDCTR